MRQLYSYIQRASVKDKNAFEEIVASLNELAPKESETIGVSIVYSLERCTSGFYTIRIDYDDKSESERGSLVRCGFCNDIRELFDGQVEFCLNCDREW